MPPLRAHALCNKHCTLPEEKLPQQRTSSRSIITWTHWNRLHGDAKQKLQDAANASKHAVHRKVLREHIAIDWAVFSLQTEIVALTQEGTMQCLETLHQQTPQLCHATGDHTFACAL